MSDKIQLKCNCGANIAVPASAAGKKGKCPKCGDVIRIPDQIPDNDVNAPTVMIPVAPEKPARPKKAQRKAKPKPEPEEGFDCPECGEFCVISAVECNGCGVGFAAEDDYEEEEEEVAPQRGKSKGMGKRAGKKDLKSRRSGRQKDVDDDEIDEKPARGKRGATRGARGKSKGRGGRRGRNDEDDDEITTSKNTMLYVLEVSGTLIALGIYAYFRISGRIQ